MNENRDSREGFSSAEEMAYHFGRENAELNRELNALHELERSVFGNSGICAACENRE